MTFSEGSGRTGIGTQQNANPIKDNVSLGRGKAAHPPTRPRQASRSLVESMAGGGAEGPGRRLLAISESGVRAGISQGKPSGCSCGGSRPCPPRAGAAWGRRAAPQSSGARGGGAPAKWSGLARGLLWERCAQGARRPCASRGAARAPGRRAVEREIKLQPPHRRRVAQPSQPRRLFASARGAAPRRSRAPPGPPSGSGSCPRAQGPAGVHPGAEGRVRGPSGRPAARALLGRPLRPTPGAMPPTPRDPRERREHGEVE